MVPMRNECGSASKALEEGLEQLKAGMEELATELRGSLEEIRAAVAEMVDTQDRGKDDDERIDGAGPDRFETDTTPPVAGTARENACHRSGLLDPEVVTEEPAEDDAEVYGVAWPLVA